MTTILAYLSQIPGIIIAIVLHEYIKALVSTKLGDPIPRQQGRLTLNPMKHVDFLGALCMLVWGYGWSNPVQTSPIYYKDKRNGTLITYLVPILFNLLLGTSLAIVFKILNNSYIEYSFGYASSASAALTAFEFLLDCLKYTAVFNISFALFSIVPVYPLDGYKIMSTYMSATSIIKMQQYEQILRIVLLFAIIFGGAGFIFDPLVGAIFGIVQ